MLDGATLSVEAGEKIGLVGRNGSGKSTLMKAMLGVITPDLGSVQLQRGARVGYLSQDPDLEPEETVREAAGRAFAELHALHVEVQSLYESMAEAEGDELERLLKRQARLESQIETAGGYAIDHRVDAMLHGLGFTDDQFGVQVGKLSGGQKGRLGLARLLLEEPDLLLLDEPTNHLDIAGRQWLETFLAESYRGAVILVSHDRWLLDRVVGRIVEVEAGVIREYPGNYAKYVELRRERQLTVARVYEKQRDKIRQEQQFIAKFKAGQRAKQARGRQTRLERFKNEEMVERPAELSVMRLNLPSAERSGEQVVTVESIAKRYGELTLFESFDLAVRRGDRIGVIGPNGVGKTTLIRCLVGELDPDEGEVRAGSRISIGHYRQLHDHLDMSLTIWQYLQSVIVSLEGAARATEQQARDLAGAFLFSGADQEKTLDLVSGGERSRAVLAGLVAGAHNLLVLDEPSNHLDIPSAERLEGALSRDGGFEGTLILISHDRALLEATCDRLIVFSHGEPPRVFDGHYSEWIRRSEAEAAAAVPEAAPVRKSRPSKPRPEAEEPVRPAGPFARLSLRDLEARIEAMEEQIGELDTQMLQPEVYTDGDRCRTIQAERTARQDDLEELESEWARRAE